MTKKKFLNDLRRNLNEYPKDFIEETIEYYNETIEDAIEDGLTEEEAIKHLGSFGEVIESIRDNASIRKINPNNKISSNIILVILLFPLWFPLGISFFAVLLAISVGFIVGLVGLAASSLVITLSSFMLISKGLPAAFGLNFGGGLALIGLSILLFFLTVYVLKFNFKLSKKGFYFLKNMLTKGEISYE